ncbi:MAG: hypothetical protein RLZZ17_588 [Actinomycetota bacterium]|nr:DUF3000 domain-containing protein [Actinomycetota bacterium]NDB08365.1 DUF3000 domain-containing protein [Actinomycetota bacterium]
MISQYFDDFIHQISLIPIRSEVIMEEVPPPSKLAPHAYAITAEIPSRPFDDSGDGSFDDSDDYLATGRFVLLADPQYKEAWQGEFRAVTFVRAPIDDEMAADPLLNDVGWSWLKDSLESSEAHAIAMSGTVTRVASKSFGQLAPQPDQSEIEIRGSWTPTDGSSLVNHAKAWLALLEMVAGIVPLPDGVTALTRRR